MRRGELLAQLSRHEEAERAYSDAVSALDEALRLAADDLSAHFNKALVLLQWGEAAQPFVSENATRARWEEARTHAEHALDLTPEDEGSVQLLAHINQHLEEIDTDDSQR